MLVHEIIVVQVETNPNPSHVGIEREPTVSTIIKYARAVVEADVSLFSTQHIIARIMEVDPTHDELEGLRLTEVREQLILTGAIALLGTCDGAFDDLTITEDGKVVRAYSLLAAE